MLLRYDTTRYLLATERVQDFLISHRGWLSPLLWSGLREETRRIHFFENCDGEDVRRQTPLQQSLKSDLFPAKPPIDIVLILVRRVKISFRVQKPILWSE